MRTFARAERRSSAGIGTLGPAASPSVHQDRPERDAPGSGRATRYGSSLPVEGRAGDEGQDDWAAFLSSVRPSAASSTQPPTTVGSLQQPEPGSAGGEAEAAPSQGGPGTAASRAASTPAPGRPSTSPGARSGPRQDIRSFLAPGSAGPIRQKAKEPSQAKGRKVAQLAGPPAQANLIYMLATKQPLTGAQPGAFGGDARGSQESGSEGGATFDPEGHEAAVQDVAFTAAGTATVAAAPQRPSPARRLGAWETPAMSPGLRPGAARSRAAEPASPVGTEGVARAGRVDSPDEGATPTSKPGAAHGARMDGGDSAARGAQASVRAASGQAEVLASDRNRALSPPSSMDELLRTGQAAVEGGSPTVVRHRDATPPCSEGTPESRGVRRGRKRRQSLGSDGAECDEQGGVGDGADGAAVQGRVEKKRRQRDVGGSGGGDLGGEGQPAQGPEVQSRAQGEPPGCDGKESGSEGAGGDGAISDARSKKAESDAGGTQRAGKAGTQAQEGVVSAASSQHHRAATASRGTAAGAAQDPYTGAFSMDFDDEEERDEERRATTRQNLTSTRSLPTVSGVKPEGQGSEAKGRRRRQMVRFATITEVFEFTPDDEHGSVPEYTASRVPVLLSRSTSAPSPAPRALLCKIGAEGTDAAESVFYALDGLASLSPGVALDSAVAVASALASRAGRLALRGDNDVLTRALERFATGATARGREQRGGGFLVCAGCFLLCLTQPEVCPSLQLVPTFVQLAAAVLSGFLAAPRKSVESPGLSSREQATVTPLLEALQSRGVIPSNLSPQSVSCPAALVLLALSKATNPHDPLLAAGPRLSVVLQLKDALRTSGLLHHVAEVAVVAAKELSAVRAEQHSGAGGGSRGAGSGRGGGGLVEDSGGSLTSSDAEDRDSRVPWDNGAEPRGDVLLDLIGAGFTVLEHATFVSPDNVAALVSAVIPASASDEDDATMPLSAPDGASDVSEPDSTLRPPPESFLAALLASMWTTAPAPARGVGPALSGLSPVASPPPSSGDPGTAPGPSRVAAARAQLRRDSGEEPGWRDVSVLPWGLERDTWSARERGAFHAGCALAVNLSHHQPHVCEVMVDAGAVQLGLALVALLATEPALAIPPSPRKALAVATSPVAAWVSRAALSASATSVTIVLGLLINLAESSRRPCRSVATTRFCHARGSDTTGGAGSSCPQAETPSRPSPASHCLPGGSPTRPVPLGGTQAGAAGVGEGRNAVEFLWQVFTECGRKAAGVASGAEEEEGAEVTVEDLSREEGSGELAVLESYSALLVGLVVDAAPLAMEQLNACMHGQSLQPLLHAIRKCCDFYSKAGAIEKESLEYMRALMGRLHRKEAASVLDSILAVDE